MIALPFSNKGLKGTTFLLVIFELKGYWELYIENRIYIREEFRESLGMNFFSPLSAWKCTNHVNVHKLYAVDYINTVCSLDYPFQFRIF